MLPAVLYLPLLLAGYLILRVFDTEVAEIPDKNLQTTDYINPTLPSAKMKGDGIGGKYESMVKSYGKIDDYSAIDNIDRNDDENKEEYDSKYTDRDIEILDANAGENEDALAKQQEIQEKLLESARKGAAMQDNGTSHSDNKTEQDKAIEELNKALAKARLNADDIRDNQEAEDTVEFKKEIQFTTRTQEVKENEPKEVNRHIVKPSELFNTISSKQTDAGLIKAIIDENITAVDGSRVRIRLLEDIEDDGVIVRKGSYLYAIMSGFGSQRVKGEIKSVLLHNEIIKINLSIYDTDGLEGLYIPRSSFRDTGKDVASGAMNGNINMNTAGDNSLKQWGMQAIQNTYQKTTSAISKAIKKNKAKLKYGTFVYLINKKTKKN